ncbi:MAG: nuclear transport factor 2 family protein, partial [Blastocatellia bacterium]
MAILICLHFSGNPAILLAMDLKSLGSNGWGWVMRLCGLVVLISTPGVVAPVFPQQQIEVELRTLVERYFDSYAKTDLDGLMSLWSERSPERESTRRTLQQTFANTSKLEVKNLVIQKVVIDGTDASVRASVEIGESDKDASSHLSPGRINCVLHFIQESKAWKVWRYAFAEEELATELLRVSADGERTQLLETRRELVTAALLK